MAFKPHHVCSIAADERRMLRVALRETPQPAGGIDDIVVSGRKRDVK